ncbi:DUF6894 family protein [Bradyrhizobium ottawaense]|uniref:DUF6894 family protein n=1 Tax=Bradyrhizobium ottawaense TaxID=931866 RepID=UPI00384C8855
MRAAGLPATWWRPDRETPLPDARWSGMPRYFFNITNGRPHEDALGEELPHDRAAWREGMRRACEIEDVLARRHLGT